MKMYDYGHYRFTKIEDEMKMYIHELQFMLLMFIEKPVKSV